MSNTYIQIGTYNDHSQDHSKHVTVTVPAGTNVADIVRAVLAEDITPSEDSPSVTSEFDSNITNSIIFTKKAKLEHKEPYIIHSLQKSVLGRKDKTRAFVQELHDWQNQAYVDAHFNARVMYDELEKLMPISFGYDVFRRLYNSSRN